METKVQKPKKAKKEKVEVVEPQGPTWEIKDRQYYLKGTASPLSYVLQSKSTKRKPMLWFDESKNMNREIRYASNQNSVFVDEQDKNVILDHIIFEEGALTVPKAKQNLQKLLSLYHPKKGIIYKELEPMKVAEDELDQINFEIDALNLAKNIEIDHAEAILRVEKGSRVSEMSSKEIKRDLLLMAKKNPQAFLAIANDENVGLRNTAIKAVELGIIKLSQDQRTFHWGSNDRKLMTVPFDENPYSAMAAFFKTDEGVEIFKTIEKKLQ